MALRKKTLSGEMVTITETKGTDTSRRHWYLVSGTGQGVLDYLNENGIPEHKVKGFQFVSSVYYVLYHK